MMREVVVCSEVDHLSNVEGNSRISRIAHSNVQLCNSRCRRRVGNKDEAIVMRGEGRFARLDRLQDLSAMILKDLDGMHIRDVPGALGGP